MNICGQEPEGDIARKTFVVVLNHERGTEEHHGTSSNHYPNYTNLTEVQTNNNHITDQSTACNAVSKGQWHLTVLPSQQQAAGYQEKQSVECQKFVHSSLVGTGNINTTSTPSIINSNKGQYMKKLVVVPLGEKSSNLRSRALESINKDIQQHANESNLANDGHIVTEESKLQETVIEITKIGEPQVAYEGLPMFSNGGIKTGSIAFDFKKNSPITTFSKDQNMICQDAGNSPTILDESLTNIHWLGDMTGDNFAKINKAPTKHYTTDKDVKKMNRECGPHKRPAYSYMHLIQMAINSKEDKRMTLREIYHWIENTFSFYKHTAKQGWKNSIRHNLSLYDLFVREKTTAPGKHGSYWTLASDCSSFRPPPEFAVTAPAPILPRPSPQTYALIPIPNFVSVNMAATQLSQMSVSAAPLTTAGSKVDPGPPSNRKRPNSSLESQAPRTKHVKIAPNVQVYDENNIITQAWLNASCGDNISMEMNRRYDSGIDMSSGRSGSDCSIGEMPKSAPWQISPKHKKCRRRRTKSRLVRTKSSSFLGGQEADGLTCNTLSDSALKNIFENLENEFTSPIRNLLKTPPKHRDPLSTSTPYKGMCPDVELVSPIKGLTPLRNSSNLFDSAIFSPLSPGGAHRQQHSDNMKISSSTYLESKSPGFGSLGDIGIPGLTPIKPKPDIFNNSLQMVNNQSFSKIFADMGPLETLWEEGDSLPIDLSFSAIKTDAETEECL
ncbi:uncharacterized protein LOC106169393 isoform X2 [Lingula anatina]|uniref:Uncharacterized protein LOC106169393 isoform X2 n=1 Tax=Lingula anatina TaxID=7574 RepID=A0A1S3J370_LINAN|nr:uncharacterized protein LOC106169393 isoform X2 [Lingula anatina]|eukprot:XP_013404304.1 uncharacterized protein LOC106169393 isoform X2 [Lingula anatina]